MTTTIYNRSCYSLLESVTEIDDLINYALKNEFTSLGICEKNNFFSAMVFYTACKNNNINPIIGYESSVVINDKFFPILFYPKNNSGYIELNKTVYQKKQFTLQEVYDFSEDILIVITANLMQNLQEDVINNLPDNFYLAVAPENNITNKKYNEKITNYLHQYPQKFLALDLTLYPTKEDFVAYKCALAINKATDIHNTDLFFQSQAELKDREVLEKLFDTQYLLNNDSFCQQICLKIDELYSGLPAYPLKDKCVNSQTYLYNLCFVGLKKRLNDQYKPEYYQRLKYELDIIFKMNFEDYFLIIYDLILYSVKNNILVGPGRGSAVGCLVAYCLGITQIDPLKNNLYFERFLNPERISLPDIDIDFPDNKREEVIKYVINKYGADKVAHIITFNCFKVKAALKEASKALNLKESNLNLLLKCVNEREKLSLIELYQKNNRFKKTVEATTDNRLLFQVASKLENLPRYVSLHAAGIIISKKPLNDIVPLIKVSENNAVGYTMEYLEKLGLIKIDFLALRNLSIIQQIKDNIPEKIDIYKLDLTDQSTYKLLQEGKSLGIFQLESEGMIKLLKAVQPQNFSDLATLIALYRPGPLDNINQFLFNRRQKEIKYIHADLKPILQETAGIIVYQEQIMAISRKFAGFSLAKADILRKSISKKNVTLLQGLKSEFINGCLNNGYNRETTEKIYQLIEKFASYGFNKSHSYAYGFVAYIMTYLKAHYPRQFYCASLNNISGNIAEMTAFINEARQYGLRFQKANINLSQMGFISKDNIVYFGFEAIKGLSKNTAEKIISERSKQGVYQDYYQAIRRLSSIDISIKEISILISAGCCDCFKLSRKTMLNNLLETVRYCQLIRKVDGSYDESLAAKPLLEHYNDNKMQNMQDEVKYYGVYFENSPLSTARKKYRNCIVSTTDVKINQICHFVLKISNIRTIKTKNGKTMAFADATDECGAVKLTLMPNQYSFYASKLKKDAIIYIEAKKNYYGDYTVNKLEVVEV
ncbi:MAG: DNA polymerase III subunit alpha [Erysipelotrichia bacterium]|nr:DNA polymerase III subunit alpha [Erysipelotrichia bacterium]